MARRIFLTIVMSLFFFFSTTVVGFCAHWILNSNSNQLPGDLEAAINQAGGTLITTIDEVGIAVAEFATPGDAEALEAYGFDVMPDLEVNWLSEGQIPPAEHIGSNEPGYVYQWFLPVVEADKAWDEGITGDGARAAVLDTGIWIWHPDLIDNIDFAASASFVPGEVDPIDYNGHGTHIAGIIAAADNDWGCIGVAPNATLIVTKILNAQGTGKYSWFVKGVVHAVNKDADVINLSLGSYIKKSGDLPYYTARDASQLIKMIKKVLHWATSQGCLVVTPAGGGEIDLDHNEDLILLPGEAVNGIVVSATGPICRQNFGSPASYTNYGQSVIWVAAPGGDSLCYPQPRWYLDMVYSTYLYDGFAWMSGTSTAAAVVSGVAALVIEKYGLMNPGELKNHLAQTADDLGKPGNDDYYGRGRINAYKAVTK
jgi:subtilisin family serine protease